MKHKQSKLFELITLVIIAGVILAACAPSAESSNTGEATQPPAPTMSEATQPPAPTMVEATQPPAPTMVEATQPSASPTMEQTSESAESAAKIDPLVFQQAVRKLWEDHITWTRVYIISALAGLPDADAAAQRLLQNQVDIGNAVKPFYGEQAAGQLTTLLNDHILTAVDLLDAAKAGDTAGVEAASKSWYDNANQIASFLSTANPDNWPLADMQSMMKSHLDLTLEEATARLNSDWAADVAAYDKVHDEILMMADSLAEGIIKQFPDQFAPLEASQQQVELTLAMDRLWEDHVTWTRVYIISVAADLPDADAAAERLLRNQVDIGNAIKTLYGDQAGEQLTSLLNDHILIAVDLLAAAKAGDTAGVEAASQSWYDNADQIAGFLSTANPDNWPLSDMQSMMKAHLDLTLEEATARLQGDWAADVAAYDKVHNEILEMAGMLTKGIVAQFPDQFK